MTTLLDHIPEATRPKQAGLPCRVCGSSDALSITTEEGDTGLVKCFSCQWGGTGAQYLADGFGLDLHDALVQLGAEDADDFATRDSRSRRGARYLAQKRAQEEEDRIKKRLADNFNQPPGTGYTTVEVGRLREAMNEEEAARFEEAMLQATEASDRQEAGDRLTALLREIEQQIRARMDEVDRADTNIDFITEEEESA